MVLLTECIPSDILLDKMFPSPPIVKSLVKFIVCIAPVNALYEDNEPQFGSELLPVTFIGIGIYAAVLSSNSFP